MVVYTYDTLNRQTKAETTSGAWGDAYTYDGFGNLTNKTPTKGSAPVFSAAYDAATNRQVGLTYDANGNPAVYGGFPYDVENRSLAPPVGNFSGWMIPGASGYSRKSRERLRATRCANCTSMGSTARSWRRTTATTMIRTHHGVCHCP